MKCFCQIPGSCKTRTCRIEEGWGECIFGAVRKSCMLEYMNETSMNLVIGFCTQICFNVKVLFHLIGDRKDPSGACTIQMFIMQTQAVQISKATRGESTIVNQQSWVWLYLRSLPPVLALLQISIRYLLYNTDVLAYHGELDCYHVCYIIPNHCTT